MLLLGPKIVPFILGDEQTVQFDQSMGRKQESYQQET